MRESEWEDEGDEGVFVYACEVEGLEAELHGVEAHGGCGLEFELGLGAQVGAEGGEVTRGKVR